VLEREVCGCEDSSRAKGFVSEELLFWLRYLLEIIIFLFSFYHHYDDISLHYATVQEGIK
jgi:hypothetical protein